MIALIQRVNYAKVFISNELYSEIGEGLLVFVGIEKKDSRSNIGKLLEKLLAYRIFNDDEGKMNLSVQDKNGEIMLVSQFTLAASTNKGLRPGFSSAKIPSEAKELFDYLLSFAKGKYPKTKSGKFAADMRIVLENNGPVTFHMQG